jgi:hypothetical protein
MALLITPGRLPVYRSPNKRAPPGNLGIFSPFARASEYQASLIWRHIMNACPAGSVSLLVETSHRT